MSPTLLRRSAAPCALRFSATTVVRCRGCLALPTPHLGEVGVPFRCLAVRGGRASMPAAYAGDGLILVPVDVDDVLRRLGGGGLLELAQIHRDSCGNCAADQWPRAISTRWFSPRRAGASRRGRPGWPQV